MTLLWITVGMEEGLGKVGATSTLYADLSIFTEWDYNGTPQEDENKARNEQMFGPVSNVKPRITTSIQAVRRNTCLKNFNQKY